MATKAIAGGRGLLGITYSGKTNLEVPSATRSLGKTRSMTVSQPKQTPATGAYDKQRQQARIRALRSAPYGEQLKSAYYVGNPTVPSPQSMTVAQRMDIRNKILSGAYKRRSDIPAMPAATGEESITVKKTARKPAAPARKPTEITVPDGGLRTSTKAKAKAPTRMAVNPRTGSTLGFTTGKTTGSTSFKPGVATKTRVSPAQQMARNAFNKGGVAGPSRSGGGRSAGPSRSTSTPSRGDVGAGRRGGGR